MKITIENRRAISSQRRCSVGVSWIHILNEDNISLYIFRITDGSKEQLKSSMNNLDKRGSAYLTIVTWSTNELSRMSGIACGTS